MSKSGNVATAGGFFVAISTTKSTSNKSSSQPVATSYPANKSTKA